MEIAKLSYLNCYKRFIIFFLCVWWSEDNYFGNWFSPTSALRQDLSYFWYSTAHMSLSSICLSPPPTTQEFWDDRSLPLHRFFFFKYVGPRDQSWTIRLVLLFTEPSFWNYLDFYEEIFLFKNFILCILISYPSFLISILTQFPVLIFKNLLNPTGVACILHMWTSTEIWNTKFFKNKTRIRNPHI